MTEIDRSEPHYFPDVSVYETEILNIIQAQAHSPPPPLNHPPTLRIAPQIIGTNSHKID